MEIYEGLSLGEMLVQGAKQVPDKIAVIDGDRRIGYKQLNNITDAMASLFHEVGFGKGDRVAIYMKSSIEFVATFYALQKLGVIVAWVNPNYRRAETEFILRNSGAKGVVIFREWEGHDFLEGISKIRANLPALESIILIGDGEGEGVHAIKDVLTLRTGKGYSPPSISPKEDLAMLIYTSGTTGRPKGAMITHYQSIRAGWEYSQGTNTTSEDIFIGVLPMSHSYGCGSTLIQPILVQSTLVLVEKFDPETAFQLIEKEKVTLQLGAPVHYILELNHPKRKEYNLSSLRAGLIAGQIAPEGLITRVEKEMGVYLTSFWGASEVGPGVGIMCPYPTPLDLREAYVGQAIADTQIRVIDPVTREEVADGEIGELILSGWHVLKGYWENPEETKKQIIDGWLYTGDLVSKEKDGYFRIYGRTKDLINRGGFKIYPSELESLLVDHPKVGEVSVVATPNPVLGESICVCLIPRGGGKVTLKELRDFLKEKVAPHKLPDELCIMSEFPRLSGGVKLNKFGQGGLVELAKADVTRERQRK